MHEDEAEEISTRQEVGPLAAGPMDLWVGHRVGVRIYQLGISRRSVADRLGQTQIQLRRYLRAQNRMTAQKLYDLSAILRTHPGWFFEGAPEDLPLGPMPDAMTREQSELLSPEALELVGRFNRLSTPRKRLLRDVLSALLGEQMKDEK